MADVIAIGEILADFAPVGEQDGNTLYMRSAGGSPANVAVQIAKLGMTSAFMGKVGDDSLGEFLRETLDTYGVDTSSLAIDRHAATSIAFVGYDEDNARRFSFYRDADMRLCESDLKLHMIDYCRALYFGSISMMTESSKAATLAAVNYARERGKIICYDPNWRPALWRSKTEAIALMKSVLPLCDIIKVSERELEMIADCGGFLQGIARVLGMGVKMLIVTQGAKGCVIACRGEIKQLETYTHVETIDTIGSGDSFCGGFLYKLLMSGKPIDDMTFSELVGFADFANACASACSTRHGAMSAMPTLEEAAAVRDHGLTPHMV